MQTVLVVDDDIKLLKMLQRTLVYEGMDVITASNGQEALSIIATRCPDAIVVDWMMPKVSGIDLVRRLRADGNQTMVLMLTARDAIEDRVEGLETGADDYLVKPFAPVELVARVRAMLRRSGSLQNRQIVYFGDLALDPLSHQASRGGVTLALSPTEFELLHLFLRHPRQVLESDQILSHVWGYDFGGDKNVLEVYIGYLRKKTEEGGRSRLIHTVRGVGYVLREA